MAKSVSYLSRVIKGYAKLPLDFSCPYCAGQSRQAGHKHLLLRLRVCQSCGLKFRFPKDESAKARDYYERYYVEKTVTDFPSLDELETMVTHGFRGTPFDKADKVAYVRQRESDRSIKILDYGASWGYFLAQLRFAGFANLQGFELARTRAQAGSLHLREQILSSPERILLERPFDLITLSHVLEHLPAPRDVLELFPKLLKKGGRLIIWVPNASVPALERFQGNWAELVGEPHPLAFDYDWFERNLPTHGFKIIEMGDPAATELCLRAEKI